MPLLSGRHHLSYEACLEDKSKNYQECFCTVLCMTLVHSDTDTIEPFLKMSLSISLGLVFVHLLWQPLCSNCSVQAIMFSSCGFFFFLLFFIICSQWSQIGCLPYFRTRCGLSANLECRSEICCTRLTQNTGCKNSPCVQHLTLCRAIPSQLRHV